MSQLLYSTLMACLGGYTVHCYMVCLSGYTVNVYMACLSGYTVPLSRACLSGYTVHYGGLSQISLEIYDKRL